MDEGRKIALMESAPADVLVGRMLDRRYDVRSRIEDVTPEEMDRRMAKMKATA